MGGLMIKNLIDLIFSSENEFFKIVFEYSESDEQINVVENCAVVSFKFEMIYEREKYRNKSTGRDFWTFLKEEDNWLAVWRAIIDVNEIGLIEK